MKRTQAESGGRNSRAHNNCYRLTTIPQGGGRGVRSEAVKLNLGRSGEGRWRFTVFDFVSHYAILIGNKLKSLLLMMVTCKHSSHLSQPMKFLFSSPTS